jgi:hypothetical protein
LFGLFRILNHIGENIFELLSLVLVKQWLIWLLAFVWLNVPVALAGELHEQILERRLLARADVLENLRAFSSDSWNYCFANHKGNTGCQHGWGYQNP